MVEFFLPPLRFLLFAGSFSAILNSMLSPTRAFPWLYWSITCWWLAALFGGGAWLFDHNGWANVIDDSSLTRTVLSPSWDAPRAEDGSIVSSPERDALIQRAKEEWVDERRIGKPIHSGMIIATAVLIVLGFILGSVSWVKMRKHWYTKGASVLGTLGVNLFALLASVVMLSLSVYFVTQPGSLELKYVFRLITALVLCFGTGAWFWTVFKILRSPKEDQMETPLPESWKWSFTMALALPLVMFLGAAFWLSSQERKQRVAWERLEEESKSFSEAHAAAVLKSGKAKFKNLEEWERSEFLNGRRPPRTGFPSF